MFSNLVKRNSKRDRKDNGLYFGSMIISIVAFYIILSLSHQDVMLFLQKMESDAVNKLFAIIPIFYGATLAILFFLVYFVSRIQTERRRHEFGVYLTLGMKRYKLFSLLLLEDLRNNTMALGLGLPLAIMLSELISLVTAKVVGLGIIEHRFSLSLVAILFTAIGFLLVKLGAFIVLSSEIAQKEIGQLLVYEPSGIKQQLPNRVYLISLIGGLLLLGKAYSLGISGQAWINISNMEITVFLGFGGTILLFFGMRLLISGLINLGSKKNLATYNFRQIQELVIHRSTVLAICSLLIFLALCLFGAGATISINRSNNSRHVLDYTFKDKSLKEDENLDIDQVRKILKTAGIEARFSKLLAVKIGYPKEKSTISFANIVQKIKESEDSENKATLIHNFNQYDDCYLMSLSGYNAIREAANLKPIKLKNNEASLYMGQDFVVDEKLMNSVVSSGPKIKILGNNLKLVGNIQTLPIVTDREIILSVALIVTDDTFEAYTGGIHSTYVSGVLKKALVQEKGLMMAISDTNAKLNKTGLSYESYIQNMGRELFYVIAASYITIYLALIFLVVANTIIGVQFLMEQRKSAKRYQTLINLGASYQTLCQSTGKQINWYFGLPVLVAVINSFFGVLSLFTGILPTATKMNLGHLLIIAILIILLLGLFEFIYILLVKRSSNQYLGTLMEPKREE